MTIFRENALKAVEGRVLAHTSLTVITPSAILGMVASLLMLLVLIVWGWFANIPMTVEGAGMVVSEHDWNHALLENEKTMAAKREQLQEAANLLNKKRMLYQKHYLTENDMVQAEHDYLEAKNAYASPNVSDYIGLGGLFTNTKAGDEPMNALVLISNDDAKRVQTGMPVQLFPRQLSNSTSLGLKGNLSEVSLYPVSKEAALAYLGNKNMVDNLFAQGDPYFAVIKTNAKLQAGMLVTAKVVTHTCHPIQLLNQPDC